MDRKEILLKAAELLEAKGWCQWSYANDAGGNRVCPTSEAAVSFCISGACAAVAGWSLVPFQGRGTHKTDIESVLPEKDFDGSAELWNNHTTRTKDQVIQKLRELAESSL